MQMTRLKSWFLCNIEADSRRPERTPVRIRTPTPPLREYGYEESNARVDAALALVSRADELLRGNRNESALFMLRQAENICPEIATSAVRQAWIYIGRREADPARLATERARKLSPFHPDLDKLQQAINNLA